MKLFTLILSMFVLAASSAFADECTVSSAGELSERITEIAQSGACATDSAVYRQRYENYRGTSIVFHVIHFTSSVDINSSMPCMTGFGGDPLVIIADASLYVKFAGLGETCIEGSGGPVILDNIIFKSGGVKISSNKNSILNSKLIGGSLKITGNENQIVSSESSGTSSDGIEISGDENKISASSIHDNAKNGIFITGHGTKVLESKIYNNKQHGVYVRTCGGNIDCAEPRTALISKTIFSGNSGRSIEVEKWPMPAPVDLVSVGTSNEWKITGNLSHVAGADDPWKLLNVTEVKIELFSQNGEFVAETDLIDPKTRQFVFTLAKNSDVAPVFVATAVDYENNNTSPFSENPDASDQNDFDGDSIPNDQEDYNHNGIVDFGETDPRNSDTDGDGLTDGEERLHIGHVQEAMKKMPFADLSKLDPTNPDSDGDCLNDGLELGMTSTSVIASSAKQSSAVSVIQTILTPSPLASPPAVWRMGEGRGEGLSPSCKSILKKHNLLDASWLDADVTTMTDPTNSDTDNDGSKDGEEDWNFDGKVEISPECRLQSAEAQAKSCSPMFIETDPKDPDSDGDTLLDGAEGDRNGNGKLDENETDPLLKDTDGDGIADNVEISRFGSLPNACDTDKDGLSDGVEAGAINPNAKDPACDGLQTAGTNFASIGVLSPVKVDSDNDGIADGDEDLNHNGWLDLGETDPTTSDTDGDEISDHVEKMLDIDHDGVPDVDTALLSNGKKCSPPKNADDADCDSIPNVRDDDSDNDGCSDREEGIHNDKNMDGIPDVWQQEIANCGNASAVGAANGGGGSSSSVASPAPPATPSPNIDTYQNKLMEGGGDCSLAENATPNGASSLGLVLMFGGLLTICSCKVYFAKSRQSKLCHYK